MAKAAMKARSVPDGATPTGSDRKALVEAQIYERALDLFATRGFASTSLQDIADSVGTSRPALYYYVRTKEEILERLVSEVSGRVPQIIEFARRSGGTPEQRLRVIVESTVRQRIVDPKRFRVLDRCERDLSEPLASKHRRDKLKFLHGITDILAEGMRSGVFRPVDEHVAAFGIIGLCNWVSWWYQPGRGPEPSQVITQLVDAAMATVLRTEMPAAPGDLHALVERLRADLLVLERMIPTLKVDG